MKKLIFLLVIICTLTLTACRENAESSETSLQTGVVQQSDIKSPDKDESTKISMQTMEEAEINSFMLRYNGFDTGVEIYLKDCVCEYDMNSIQVYSCYVNDFSLETEGYVLYIQTPDDTSTIFPVKDYLIDKNDESLYMLWGINTFERIQGVSFKDGERGDFKIQGIESMEELIGEAYNLELSEDGNDFDDMQVEFIELFEENGNKVLCGSASAVYRTSGKCYSVEWEINVDTFEETAKAYAGQPS